jgi:hypothetical protein
MTEYRDNEELFSSSIVQVNNNQNSNDVFGTGFIIGQDDSHVYVLTCAHVIEKLEDVKSVRIRGREVDVERAGKGNEIDLSILKMKRTQADKFLELQFSEPVKQKVIIIGFHKYDQHRPRRKVCGRVGERLPFENKFGTISMDVWDLEIEDNIYALEPGYSGSPVFDADNYKVIGVVAYKQGDTRGAVVCIDNIYKIWPQPLLGDVSSGGMGYLNEEMYSENTTKQTKNEISFQKKKDKKHKIALQKGPKRANELYNLAEDLMYLAFMIKNASNFEHQLIEEIYIEAQNCFEEAWKTRKHPRFLTGRARALFESDEYNETEALRCCEEAISLYPDYADAYKLHVKICQSLERSGYQTTEMRKKIKRSLRMLVNLEEDIEEELINEYLSNS